MRVDFKIEGMERAEMIIKQIEEKQKELNRLCYDLGDCFRFVKLEVKEQPQEAAAQEKVID